MSNSKQQNLKNAPAVFLDTASLNLGDIDLSPLQRAAEALRLFDNASARELAEQNLQPWCVIVNKIQLNEEFFQQHPQVRLVCITATGTNNVDLQAAKARGVAVVHCRGYSTDTVAQHVLMLILTLVRNFPAYHRDIANGDWSRSPLFCLLRHPIRETQGLKLGIIGYGDIGQKVAALATAFGMEIVIAERHGCKVRPGRTDLDTVLATCDVITLHCPSTPETRNLMNRRAFDLMRKDALLINTARGDLIDEAALLDALQNRSIAGAAIDVLSTEPPPPDHPLLTAGLPNLVVTPHNAWGSVEARQRAIDQTAENITGWLAGESVRRVV